MNIICPICKRNIPEEYQEEHHLIPRQVSRRNKYAKIDVKETANVCKNCGDQIHKLFSIKELADNYNTIEKILMHPDIQKWASWIGKKPNDFSVCMKEKKKR